MPRLVSSACLAIVLAVLSVLTPAHAEGDLSGRDLLYRKHVDAAHLAWEDGQLTMKVIDGSTPRDPSTVAVRLGPDALSNGTEVSRMRVPNHPHYSFIGNPGDVVWLAPAQLHRGHLPVWAGLGVGQFPAEIEDQVLPETMYIEYLSHTGPGRFTIWSRSMDRDASPLIVSDDDAHHRAYMTPGRMVTSIGRSPSRAAMTSPGVGWCRPATGRPSRLSQAR